MAAKAHASDGEAQEAVLIARCRGGESAAFRALYELHFPFVHRLARHLGTPPAELDDVTQEVFSNAFGKLDHFGGGNFGHWIHRICANVVTDHHRKRRVRSALRSLIGLTERAAALAPTPEDLLGRTQAEHHVSAIMARLRPKQREVFVLFEIEKWSGEAIAERLGCPVNTVWTRLYHARRAFVQIGQKRGWIEDGA